MILVYTAFGLAMSIMISRQFIGGLPDSLSESTYIDGSLLIRTFVSRVIPTSMPIAVTVGIINTMEI